MKCEGEMDPDEDNPAVAAAVGDEGVDELAFAFALALALVNERAPMVAEEVGCKVDNTSLPTGMNCCVFFSIL